MLCTPPAFILSQDQTLEKIISYLSCLSYNLFSSYSFLASFTLLSIYNSFDEICTLLFALYLSLVVQFSMTVRRLFSRRLCYYTTMLLHCQYFFEKFFKFFNFFYFLFKHSSFERLTILPLYYPFVKHFFEIFLNLHTLTDFEYIYNTFIVTFARLYEKNVKDLCVFTFCDSNHRYHTFLFHLQKFNFVMYSQKYHRNHLSSHLHLRRKNSALLQRLFILLYKRSDSKNRSRIYCPKHSSDLHK